MKVPDAGLVSEFAELITDHSRGIVLAGRQRNPDLAASVVAFAQACGFPVLAEPTSQLRAGIHDLDPIVAHYDAVFRNLPERLAPELVIRVGEMVTSKAVRTWLAGAHECRQVVLDPSGGWNEPTQTADLIARADPRTLFESFAELLPEGRGQDFLDSWTDADRTAAREIDAFLDGLGDELFEPRVHRRLAAVLPAAATVYVASSMPVRDLESFFPAVDRPIRFLANRGANGIDGLVSSGFGACAAAPGRTFVLTGDVGLYHDMNGLLAYRRHGLEPTIVVMNNGGGSIFDFLPIAEHRDGYEELFGTPTGLDLEKAAALYGLPFSRVGSPGDLDDALRGPGLVEVPLDRPRNVELHRQLFERVSSALA
jgi:2-succinyl-5-enolpyruvyl-6-hydroxy-3-cyclohexene-1-carboxylate synthase